MYIYGNICIYIRRSTVFVYFSKNDMKLFWKLFSLKIRSFFKTKTKHIVTNIRNLHKA